MVSDWSLRAAACGVSVRAGIAVDSSKPSNADDDDAQMRISFSIVSEISSAFRFRVLELLSHVPPSMMSLMLRQERPDGLACVLADAICALL